MFDPSEKAKLGPETEASIAAEGSFATFRRRYRTAWLIRSKYIVVRAAFVVLAMSIATPTLRSDEAGKLLKTEASPIQTEVSTVEVAEQDRLVRQLGDFDYQKRHSAFLRLWELLVQKQPGLVEKLEVAAQVNDLEVRVAARYLIFLAQFAAKPSEIAPLLDAITLIRSGDVFAMKRLAENGDWDHLEAILSIRSKELDEARQDAYQSGVYESQIIRMAWEQDESARIPGLVNLMWPDRDAVATRLLWRDIGLKSLLVPDARSNRPTGALSSDQFLARVTRGDSLDTIIDEEGVKLDEFTWSTSMSEGRWDLMLKLLERSALIVPDVNVPHTALSRAPEANKLQRGDIAINAARVALLSRWTNQSQQDKSWSQAIGDTPISEADITKLAIALASVGRTDDAIKLLREHSPSQIFEWYQFQGNLKHAFSTLGIEELDEKSLKAWLDIKLESVPITQQEDNELTERLVGLSALFYRLGDDKLSPIVDDAVLHWLTDTSNMSSAELVEKQQRSSGDIEADRWRTAMIVWSQQHRRDFAIEQLKQLMREDPDDERRGSLLYVLYRNGGETLDVSRSVDALWAWFRDQRLANATAKQPPLANSDADSSIKLDQHAEAQAVDDLEDFVHGRAPESWHENWSRIGLPRLGATLIKDSSEEESDLISFELARMAIALHRYDLAEQWLLETASSELKAIVDEIGSRNDSVDGVRLRFMGRRAMVEYFGILGDIRLHQRKLEQAAEFYGLAYRESPTEIQWAFKQAECLGLLGDRDQADTIRRQVFAVPLNREQGRALARDLEDIGELEFSTTLLNHNLRLSQLDRSQDWLTGIYLANVSQSLLSQRLEKSDSDEERLQAARDDLQMKRRAVLCKLDSAGKSIYTELKYVGTALESALRTEALVAILERDFEKADRTLRQCFALCPEQIETPLELVPIAEKIFPPEMVDSWVGLYAGALEAHLRHWPDDTLNGNNLAWLYARLNRNLDRALELSQRVCRRLPDDPIYLDTLAEVYFRRGDHAKAVEMAARCREICPLDENHRQQLHRFRNR